MADKIPGKVDLGNGVYGTNKEGYTIDPSTGATILPTTKPGLGGGQRGRQEVFEIQTVGDGGVIIPDSTVELEIKKTSGGKQVTYTDGENEQPSVEAASVQSEVQVNLAQKPESSALPSALDKLPQAAQPMPPKVKVGFSNEMLKLSLKWHSVVIEPAETGTGYTIVLIYNLDYDPEFEINLPMGAEYDLTITTDNGSITTCKKAYYGGQAFKFKGWAFNVLFCPEAYQEEI